MLPEQPGLGRLPVLSLLLGVGRAPHSLLEVGEERQEVRPHVSVELLHLVVFTHDLATVFARVVGLPSYGDQGEPWSRPAGSTLTTIVA